MKKHDTYIWQTSIFFMSALVVTFIYASIFNKCERAKEDGLFFPQELKVELAPDPVGTEDSIPVEELIRRSDEMIRQMYIQAIESSQGGNQLKLIFSDASWHNPWNKMVYIGSFIAVILLYFLFRTIKSRMRNIHLWPEAILEHNLHYLIPLFLLLFLLMALLNLSFPFNKYNRDLADPLFCLVAMASLMASLYAIVRMVRMTRNPRFTSGSKVVRKSHRRDTMLWAALAGWGLAYLCYFIGMYTIGTQKSMLANLLRPALSATKMFILADSSSDLSYVLRQSGAFMGFYSLTKLYVITITSISVLSLLWYRISNHFKLRWADSSGKKAYVFWGATPDSLQMAKSISDHHLENGDMDYLMLFIDSKENAGEAFAQSPSVEKFFGMFTHNREAFEAVEELDAHILIINTDISGQECSDFLKAKRPDKGSVWKELRLGKVEELMRQSSQTHMFFLDEDENKNIQGAYNVVEMLKKMESDKEVFLYSRARKEGIGGTLLPIEKDFPNKRVKVHILDTSMLAVKTLVRSGDSRYHPVHYVEDVDYGNATVGACFNCCVIGFGETGQDMASFLYEFGAFLDKRCADPECGHTYRSPFHCDIYDRDAMELREKFKARAPGAVNAFNVRIDEQGNAVEDVGDPMLRFHKGLPFHDAPDPGETPDFAKMNYVVLSLGSDELNMSMLSLMMDMLVRVRNGRMGNLLVMVRNYSKACEEAMTRLQGHYNSLYGDDARNVVGIFGQKKLLYSYGVVVDDEITKYAKRFYDQYRRIEGDSTTWEERHVQMKERTRLENENSIQRKEGQDAENYIHVGTKLQLMGIGPDGLWNADCCRFIEDCNKSIRVEKDKDKMNTINLEGHGQLITNLARTEHLRWMASCEMSGYTPNQGVGCDELSKTHNCLVSWEQLPEVSKRHNDYEKARNPQSPYLLDYRAFDYIVVKTTFEIALEKVRRITHPDGKSLPPANLIQ